MKLQKVYIIVEITGDSYEIRTRNILCFFDKNIAKEYLDWVQNFIPCYEAQESYKKACLYELYKMGLIYDWRDINDFEIPDYRIEEVEVYED